MTVCRLFAAIALTVVTSAHAEDAATQHGNEVFQHWCAPCHGSGFGKPGTAALAFKYKGEKPALLEQRIDLTPDLVRYLVRHGIFTMPPSRKTEISDADLDALVAYLCRNTPSPTAAPP